MYNTNGSSTEDKYELTISVSDENIEHILEWLKELRESMLFGQHDKGVHLHLKYPGKPTDYTFFNNYSDVDSFSDGLRIGSEAVKRAMVSKIEDTGSK